MSSVATEGGIQVSCAQPGCHWKGSPADAPGHDCPTPAQADVDEAEAVLAGEAGDSGHPFVGMIGSDGAHIVEEIDPADPFVVVWTSENGEEIRKIGSRETEELALELAAMTEPGRGSVEVKRVGVAEPPAEEVAKAEEAIGAEDEPETDAQIAAWLANFGAYDDQGVPQDEKTARLDAKIGESLGETPRAQDDEEPTPQAVPEPEPDLEEPEEQIAATGKLEILWAEGEEPWQVEIARALELQPEVAAYRWLVVDTEAAEIVGRAKVKKEIEELLENVRAAAETAEPPNLQIVKTQALLEEAEGLEIERRRQLVPPEEPTEVDATPADDPEPDPEPSPEEAKPEAASTLRTPKPAAGEEKAETKLFDDSDFEREDLALPQVDGHPIDRIAVQIGGEVMLDRSNPDHVALFRRLKLGATVELWVEAKGLGFAGKGATNKDGALDVVIAKRSLSVQAIRVIPAEGLEDLKTELAAQATDAHEAGDDR